MLKSAFVSTCSRSSRGIPTSTKPRSASGSTTEWSPGASLAIERALERRGERHARRIGVEVRDGIATLTGSVYSWSERRSVLGAARSTPGVRAVEDQLWPEE
jgi:hypothetical protein